MPSAAVDIILRAGFCAEARVVFAAMAVAPDSGRKKLYNALIQSLKNAGVWDRLDCLYLFAAHDAQAARLNLKNPGTFNATAVNSPTFTTDRGYAGDGATSYLDTNFNPSTAAGLFTQDSASMGVWQRSTGQAATGIVGWYDGSDGAHVTPRFTDDNYYFRLNQALGSSLAMVNGAGFSSVNRSASDATQAYKNGVAQTVTSNPNTTSTAMNSATFKIGTIAAGAFNASEVAVYYNGSSLTATESAAFYDALNAYMTAVGAA